MDGLILEPKDILENYRFANFVSINQQVEFRDACLKDFENYYYQKFQEEYRKRRSPSED